MSRPSVDMMGSAEYLSTVLGENRRRHSASLLPNQAPCKVVAMGSQGVVARGYLDTKNSNWRQRRVKVWFCTHSVDWAGVYL